MTEQVKIEIELVITDQSDIKDIFKNPEFLEMIKSRKGVLDVKIKINGEPTQSSNKTTK